MKTLKLKKRYSGYYTNRVGDIIKKKKKNYLKSDEWQATIEKYSHTAKDFEGKEVEIFDELTDAFYGTTKKEVSQSLTNWIINNL